MNLPQFLSSEIRLAFKACAPRSNYHAYRQFGSCSTRLQRPKRKPQIPTKSPSRRNGNEDDDSVKHHTSRLPVDTPSNTALVVENPRTQRLSTERRENIPLKVIPNAKLTPNLTISPHQRLHIEALTRRAPQLSTTKNVYKERLLIYHFGTGREKFLILLKFAAIFTAGFVEAIVVPAHLAAGTSWWMVGLFAIGGLLPFGIIHTVTKPWVTRIFLHLPPYARQTPKTAMDYAKNLPANAMIDIEYLRPVPLPSKITASFFDLAPAKDWWRMVTFKWIGHRADAGTFLKRNPTEFYVKPESSRGKAARFTIPGIWTTVYHRLAGAETTSVSRWKR